MLNRLGELLTEDRYEFPHSHICQICEWGGSPDTSGSQQQIMQGQQAGIKALQDMYWQARADVAPWRTAGGTLTTLPGGQQQVGGAVGQIMSNLGLPGGTGIDPTTALTSTPGYKFLQDQGSQMLARYGAASGLGLSGAAAKGAQNYGQNLAQTYAWGPYMSSLQNLSGQGLQAGGMSGNWAMQTGQAEANLYGNTAQQLANLQMQQQMYDANNSPWNDIMGGVGFLGSMALAPFTGGGSLAGIPGSLSNMFSGGGGGGYGNSMGSLMSNPNYGGITLSKFMADGGPTEANRPYIIGERGPELFVPDRPGFIIPNHLMDYSSMSDYRMAA